MVFATPLSGRKRKVGLYLRLRDTAFRSRTEDEALDLKTTHTGLQLCMRGFRLDQRLGFAPDVMDVSRHKVM